MDVYIKYASFLWCFGRKYYHRSHQKYRKGKEYKNIWCICHYWEKFTTGTEGLGFKAQAQLIYQYLMFDVIDNIDNFEMNMGPPSSMVKYVLGLHRWQAFSMNDDL